MKLLLSLLCTCCALCAYSQTMPPKQAYPLLVKQIHSGHSLTDPLFHPHWPGQYVNLIGRVAQRPAWQLLDDVVGKSTIPGSSLKYRWENPPGYGSPDARHAISNWEVLSITERIPLLYEGGSTQQWYIEALQEQREYFSLFVNNAWTLGNNGSGAATLLWSTWVNLDDGEAAFRASLDVQGKEWEQMQDYANARRPDGAPPVYIIPGHKMMARLYDDIVDGQVPGISSIRDFFSDQVHTNELGAYAISLIHYACIFNKTPVGLPVDLILEAPHGTPKPSAELALYLQRMIWEVVTSYPRSGVVHAGLTVSESEIELYAAPNSRRTITIYTEHAWTATTTDAWLSVVPRSGVGTADVVVTAEGNVLSTPRATTLVIDAGEHGGAEVRVVQSDTSLTTVNVAGADAVAHIYPNPADDVLVVTSHFFPKNGYSYMLYSTNGERFPLEAVSSTENSVVLDVRSLFSGIYVLALDSHGKQQRYIVSVVH